MTSPMPMLILEGKSWWESFSSFLFSFLCLSYFFSLLCKYVKSIQKVNSFHFVFVKGYFHCNRPITIHVTDRLYQLYPWHTHDGLIIHSPRVANAYPSSCSSSKLPHEADAFVASRIKRERAQQCCVSPTTSKVPSAP